MIPADELDRLRVVLVRTRNPLNLGAAARAMSNFGVSHLRVVRPWEPSFQEARSAVGASALLARAEPYPTVAEAVADCLLVVGTTALARRQLLHPLRGLEPGAVLIRRQLRSAPVALLFGSEKVGLSNRDLSHCHWLMRIPTRPQHATMNLGQAVAVCLYELIRTAKMDRPAERSQPASAATLEMITSILVDALGESGYLKSGSEDQATEKTRRLIRRLHLEGADAEVWLGMMRQILWKLRRARAG